MKFFAINAIIAAALLMSVNAADVNQHYLPPKAAASTSSVSYAAPAATHVSFVPAATYQVSYSVPAPSVSKHHVRIAAVAPSYHVPVYTAAASYQAPVYVAPVAVATYSAPVYSAPKPVVHYSAPVAAASYSVPTYAAELSNIQAILSESTKYDTKYAANGGYEYRTKRSL